MRAGVSGQRGLGERAISWVRYASARNLCPSHPLRHGASARAPTRQRRRLEETCRTGTSNARSPAPGGCSGQRLRDRHRVDNHDLFTAASVKTPHPQSECGAAPTTPTTLLSPVRPAGTRSPCATSPLAEADAEATETEEADGIALATGTHEQVAVATCAHRGGRWRGAVHRMGGEESEAAPPAPVWGSLRRRRNGRRPGSCAHRRAAPEGTRTRHGRCVRPWACTAQSRAAQK